METVYAIAWFIGSCAYTKGTNELDRLSSNISIIGFRNGGTNNEWMIVVHLLCFSSGIWSSFCSQIPRKCDTMCIYFDVCSDMNPPHHYCKIDSDTTSESVENFSWGGRPGHRSPSPRRTSPPFRQVRFLKIIPGNRRTASNGDVIRKSAENFCDEIDVVIPVSHCHWYKWEFMPISSYDWGSQSNYFGWKSES